MVIRPCLGSKFLCLIRWIWAAQTVFQALNTLSFKYNVCANDFFNDLKFINNFYVGTYLDHVKC